MKTKKEEFEDILKAYYDDKYGLTISEREYDVFVDKLFNWHTEQLKAQREEDIKRVEDWRRGMSMTGAESIVIKKAHEQIMKVLEELKH